MSEPGPSPIFLAELLDTQDFAGAVKCLAADFRREHGLPPIAQVGLVVPSVVTAAMELEARGMGPFFLAAGRPVLWRERGEERSFSGRLGLAYYQGLEIEPLEPGEGSDFYRQALDPEGRIVVHHLGMVVDDVDEWAGRLEAAGAPLWVRGRIKTGPLVTEFAYLDTVRPAGLVLEFISWKLFGRKVTLPPRLVHFLGWLEKSIGPRCLSV
jgi:hypothetical protein